MGQVSKQHIETMVPKVEHFIRMTWDRQATPEELRTSLALYPVAPPAQRVQDKNSACALELQDADDPNIYWVEPNENAVRGESFCQA